MNIQPKQAVALSAKNFAGNRVLKGKIARWSAICVLALNIPSALLAQDEEQAVEAPRPAYKESDADIAPIIVTGGENDTEKVIVGSRIPRKPLFTNLNYASSTGLAGAPGGGFEPFHPQNPIRFREIRSCTSDSEQVSEGVACLLAKSDALLAEGDTAGARDLMRYVSGEASFGAMENLQGAKRLYAIGQASQNDALREEALVRMLRTSAVPTVEQPAILRTLFAMAMRRGDENVAIERLEDVILLDANDAQSLANLAALKQRSGQSGASDLMTRAIAIKEAQAQSVPESWRALASSGQ